MAGLTETEAAAGMLKLFNSPITPGPLASPRLGPVLPEFELGSSMEQNGADRFRAKELVVKSREKPNLNTLIVVLERSIPSKGLVKKMVVRKADGSRASPRMTHFDRPQPTLPRLRSQVKGRNHRGYLESSVKLPKKRKISIDSDGNYNESPFSSQYETATVGFDGEVRVGSYTLDERKMLLKRFLEKRAKRVWRKKIKYSVRKKFADSRLRVKGRFISKGDESSLRESLFIAM